MRALVPDYTSGIGLRDGYEGRIPTRMRCVLAGRTYRHLCIRQGQDATRPIGELAGRGRRAEARQLLAEIYGWCTESFGTVNLWEAQALLEELS
jgi:hypothetical protein